MNAHMPPKTLWWFLTGLIPAYPKLMTKLVPLWRDELHPEYLAYVENVKGLDTLKMSTSELWHEAQGILDAAMYYVCALMFATMGASAGSEMLTTKVYDKFAKGEGDPPASVLLMGWDNIPIRSEKSLFNLAEWVAQKIQLKDWFINTSSSEIINQLEGGITQAGIDSEVWNEFHNRFTEHITTFGHIIFQLDFAEDLPLDHPGLMVETIKMYLRGEGINPHERQLTSQEMRVSTVERVENRLKGLKRWIFRKALGWGQALAEVREDALAEIGLGYPKLREMLLCLGGHISDAGAIHNAEDIFWLEKEEIDESIQNLEAGNKLEDLSGDVKRRQHLHKRLKTHTPPAMIPVKERVMGVKTELFVSHTQEQDSVNTLSGVAASSGVVTAPACVLHGPDDFELMNPGDILVAGTTTPAWTPLFAMASGIVTDIGGPLSHGSIVAREYGIPAVMGTGEATRRIRNGQIITVDGIKGIVEILSDIGDQEG
jgi:pyruvate,water dikinase